MKKSARALLFLMIFFLALYGHVFAKERESFEPEHGSHGQENLIETKDQGDRPSSKDQEGKAEDKAQPATETKTGKDSVKAQTESSTRKDQDKPLETKNKELAEDEKSQGEKDKEDPLKAPKEEAKKEELEDLEVDSSDIPRPVGGGSSGGGSGGYCIVGPLGQGKLKHYLASPGFKLVKLAGDTKKPMQVVFKIMKLDPKDPSKVLESHLITTDEKGHLNPVYLENITTDREKYVRIYKEITEASNKYCLIDQFPPRPDDPKGPEEPDTKETDWPDLHKKKGSPEKPLPGSGSDMNPGGQPGGGSGTGGNAGEFYPPSDPRDSIPKQENKEETPPLEANKNDKFLENPPREFDAYEKNASVVFKTNNEAKLRVTIHYGKVIHTEGEDTPGRQPGGFDPQGGSKEQVPFEVSDKKTYRFNLNDVDQEAIVGTLRDFAKRRLFTLSRHLEENGPVYYQLECTLTRSTKGIYKLEEIPTDTNKGYKLESLYLRVEEDGSVFKGPSLDKLDTKILPSYDESILARETEEKELEKEIYNKQKKNWGLLKTLDVTDKDPSAYKVTIKNLGKRTPLDIREYSRGNPYTPDPNRQGFNREIPVRDFDKEMTFNTWDETQSYLGSLHFLSGQLNYLGSNGPSAYGQFELNNGLAISYYKEAPCTLGGKSFDTVFDAMAYAEEQTRSNSDAIEKSLTKLDRLRGWLEDYPEKTKTALKKAYKEWKDLKKYQDLVFLDFDQKAFEANQRLGKRTLEAFKDLKTYKVRIYKEDLLGSDFKAYSSLPMDFPDQTFDSWIWDSKNKLKALDKSGIEFKYTVEKFSSFEELENWLFKNKMDKIDTLVYQAKQKIDALVRQAFRPSLREVPVFTLVNKPETPPKTPPGTPPETPPDTPPKETPPPEEPPKETPPPKEVEKPEEKVKEKEVTPPVKTRSPKPLKKEPRGGSPKTYDPGIGAYGFTALFSGLGLEIIRRKKTKKK